MRKKELLLLAVAGLVCLFIVSAAYAAATVEDMIPMDNEAYEAHEKGIVQFSHKKHAEEYAGEYPKLYDDKGCGACHHDDKGQPLSDLKMGDDVASCIKCHDKPGRPDRDVKKKWREEGIKGAEKDKLERQWHAEAIHQNCIGCHREFKKMTDKKTAPTSCAKCHPKTK